MKRFLFAVVLVKDFWRAYPFNTDSIFAIENKGGKWIDYWLLHKIMEKKKDYWYIKNISGSP